MIPVLVATCRPEVARFAAFDAYANKLILPAGSLRRQFASPSIAASRNAACQAALDEGAEHLMFLDDDHTFAPDLVTRLLARQREVVSALYLMRRFPFNPCAFSTWNEPEGDQPPTAKVAMLIDGLSGCQRIVAAGCGGLLIRTSVLRTLTPPWFTLVYRQPDQIGEDFTFFRRLHDAKITAWLDLDTPMGHAASLVIWPIREGTHWITGIAHGKDVLPIPSALDLMKIATAESLVRER